MNDTKENNINEPADPRRRREIIKTLLIIFLAGMLILTFFSNTIMNKNLSEISTETAIAGKLTERVRGSGLVESNQSYEVTVNESKTINTIEIKTGQEVKKGDVLFTINAVENEALTEAESALDALELEYKKALLTEPLDYSAQNQAISNAREDLNRAIAVMNAAQSNESVSQAAISTYTSDKRLSASKTALQENLKAAIAAIDTDEYLDIYPEYSGNLPTLCSAYKQADEEYQAAYQIYSNAVEKGNDSSAAKADADAKMVVRDEAKLAYNTEKQAVRKELTAKLSTVSAELEEINFRISDFEASGGEGTSLTYEQAEEDVIAKERALEDLINELNKTKKTDNVTVQQSALDVEAKQKEIEKQRQKVEKMKKESAPVEIKSKYDGIVSSINVGPNDTTAVGTPLAVIDLAEEGYTVNLTVDAEKAKKIKKGTEAEIVNHWGGEIEAVLTDIKSDSQSGSKNRILVFSVSGDVESGSYIDLSIPCGSGNYDAIVPKSSVYQDNNGSFILTVNSKSSPLGNRYYAERVNVEVLASDEVSSAVEGNVGQGTYVITAASKPIKPGDQVRMKEN